MKKIFVVILIILFNQNLFPEEETLNKSNSSQKAIDFSIGIGFSQSGMLSIIHYFDYDFNGDFIRSGYSCSGYNYISLNIPFNFTYHFNNNIGMGFNYTIEIGNIFSMGIFPNPGFTLTNKFKISNKIGKNINNSSLLLEYGVMLLIMFTLMRDYYIDNNNLLVGPSVFIGKELLYRYFSFTVGGNIDVLFTSSNYYHSTEILYKDNYTFINLGIEFRWRFGFIKNIE